MKCFPKIVNDFYLLTTFSKCSILDVCQGSEYASVSICRNWPALHKKWSFPLRISSVNVAKSAGNYGFGHIYWRNSQWKSLFFVQCRQYYVIFSIYLHLKEAYSEHCQASKMVCFERSVYAMYDKSGLQADS